MGRKHRLELHDGDAKAFEDCRTIDLNDRHCLRFWSRRLGVSEDAIAEAVRDVGPNTTAVALKLDAPHDDRIAPIQSAR